MRAILLASVLTLTSWAAMARAAEPPVVVAPGGGESLAAIPARCPTFSWGAVERAEGYELVVYGLEVSGTLGGPVLRHLVPTAALSWTPSLGSCLHAGNRYAWSVRAIGTQWETAWSEPALFEVAREPTEVEFRRALAVVERYLSENELDDPAGSVSENGATGSPGIEDRSRIGAMSPPSRIQEPGALNVQGAIVADDLHETCLAIGGERWTTNGHCYKWVGSSPGVSWAEAMEYCSLVDYGYLVTVTSAAEEAFVRALTLLTGDHIWIAATDARSEGTWEWATGELGVTGNNSFYTNWAAGEPNDAYSGEDCAEMIPTGWNDASCAAQLEKFVCEKDW